MNNIEVLYSKSYIDRELYILLIDGKVAEVYRSSGLSGTGQGGQIIPFAGISDRHTLSVTLGYIFKEFFYKGYWTSHYKQIQKYPGAQKLCKELETYLNDYKPEYEPYDDSLTLETFKPIVKSIKKEIDTIREKYEPYDWGVLDTIN